MIQWNNITLTYGEKRVLDRFSLTLPERGIVCLRGPSGCGKTSLLRVLLGLQAPDSGEVLGLRRGEAAVLFQEDRLLPWYSVLKNCTAVTGCAEETARAMLRALELETEADSLPATMSGGMQRRAALARTLCYPAKLLILDEPFKGLDAALKTRLYPLILDAAKDRPVLFITHDPAEADALADVTYLLDGPPLRILE